MSTIPPLDSFRSHADFGWRKPGPGAPGEDPSVAGPDASGQDPPFDLVEQTRNQIRVLMHEITQLARADVEWPAFAEGFMSRVGTALAAVGGVLWVLDESGGLRPQYQFNWAKARLDESETAKSRHQMLLEKVLNSRQSVLVPPQSGTPDDDGAANPTDYLLILGAFQVEGKVEGLIEILQRPVSEPATQRGYLRFVVQMCDLAADYLKNRRLRDYQEQRSFWLKLEQFLQSAHRPLATHATAFVVANDGRALIECDRLSVLFHRGGRARIASVSGLDSLDRRATEIQRLERLVETSVRTDQPLWHGRGHLDHSPQIETQLASYLDQSHVKALAIIPFSSPSPAPAPEGESRSTTPPRPWGALVMEQLSDDTIRDTTRRRLMAVATHSAIALRNAVEHESILFQRTWKSLGRLFQTLAVRHFIKTAVATVAIAASAIAMRVVEAPFAVTAHGKLRPVERREIFAQTDGTVVDVSVRHESLVMQGDLLLRMRNESLDGEILSLLERQTTTREQIESKQLTLVGAKSLSSIDESILSGELSQLREVAKSIESQLQLLHEKRRQLEIRSPIKGRVMTWDVDTPLLQRPVQRGQALMALADPDGDWELELFVPERRAAPLLDTAHKLKAIPVSFALKSRPGESFDGTVTGIHRLAEVHGDEGNSIVVRVAIDKRALPESPSESTVIAKIQCGSRGLGTVWFGDVIDRVSMVRFRWLP